MHQMNDLRRIDLNLLVILDALLSEPPRSSVVTNGLAVVLNLSICRVQIQKFFVANLIGETWVAPENLKGL
ncbi:hypothetical protein PMI28_00861 [Pseudomonas sp. GM48]|nr:hypothetical protein PMI28_00861 [Pseudomonas sp. GM48]